MNKAGWIAIIMLCSLISFLVGALVWSFVKPLPNNFDLLTFIEVSLGLMIGILAIIAAAFVAFQWSGFETRLRDTIDETRRIASQEAANGAVNAFNGLVKPELNDHVERFNNLEQLVDTLDKRTKYPLGQ
jgi:hypothetical protein